MSRNFLYALTILAIISALLLFAVISESKPATDPASFNKGVVYAIRAFQIRYNAKKTLDPFVSDNTYIAGIFDVVAGLAETDSLQFAPVDTTKKVSP